MALALVAVASVGFGASLIQQEWLIALTDPTTRGQVLGLHGAGQATLQGVAAVVGRHSGRARCRCPSPSPPWRRARSSSRPSSAPSLARTRRLAAQRGAPAS